MEERHSNTIKALLGASFLLMLALSVLFLYANAPALYKQDVIGWESKYLMYLLFFSIMVSVGLLTAAKVVKDLAKARYWQSFGLRFIPSALVSFAILLVFRIFIKKATINPLDILNYVPLGVILFHAFVVAQIEEITFRGILFESFASKRGIAVASLLTAIIFAGFHYYASGGSIIVLLTYIPLSYLFTYVKLNGYPFLKNIKGIGQFFQPTRYTQQANAGMHFAWNIFILGFIRPGGF